jgi:hypothetical protein
MTLVGWGLALTHYGSIPDASSWLRRKAGSLLANRAGVKTVRGEVTAYLINQQQLHQHMLVVCPNLKVFARIAARDSMG